MDCIRPDNDEFLHRITFGSTHNTIFLWQCWPPAQRSSCICRNHREGSTTSRQGYSRPDFIPLEQPWHGSSTCCQCGLRESCGKQYVITCLLVGSMFSLQILQRTISFWSWNWEDLNLWSDRCWVRMLRSNAMQLDVWQTWQRTVYRFWTSELQSTENPL